MYFIRYVKDHNNNNNREFPWDFPIRQARLLQENMEVRLGARVIRGPDWERGNEDGGEGYVGTVVAGARDDARHDVATVQWDVGGERHVYRCGAQGKFDLRVIDSAPAGRG